jgi:hypothetical protein
LSRVTLSCGANYTILEPIFESANITALLLPAQAISQTCTITYFLGNTSTTFYYQYLSSRTPSISFSWVAGCTYLIRKVAITAANFDFIDLVLLESTGAETKVKFRMAVGVNSSNSFRIYPSNNYLPAGGYKIYAYAANYGFATVTNSTFLIQPFSSSITLAPTNSSFNGGKFISLIGGGFVEESHYNQLLVCGLESKVVAADQHSITIEVPPLLTASTLAFLERGKVEKILGQWFSDTPANIKPITSNKQTAMYTSTQIECFFGIDTGLTGAWIKKIKYSPNSSWTNTAQKLSGAVFEISDDQVSWDLLFEVDTSIVHMGENYWLNTNTTIRAARYIRFRHNSTSMCQLSSFEIMGIRLAQEQAN